MSVALLDFLGAARARDVPWIELGEFPTPVEQVPALDLWVKRDDLSGVRYGGNKVRTLESLFGRARAAGARRIWATGSAGSNHALATVLYARDAGFEPGVMLFPQPYSETARDNLEATLSQRPLARALLSWATLPWAVAWERLRAGRDSYVMVPGGATPEGALVYVSAALELAGQIRAGELPLPVRVVLGVGSTCTSAGLLVGVAAAARLGLLDRPPEICSIRVTPWPVTSAWRIVALAERTGRLLARIAGDDRLAPGWAELARGLRVVGGFIGGGYGHVTRAGLDAIEVFRRAGGPPLDTSYSAKAAAGLLARRRDLDEGPVVFWATKSSRFLPTPDPVAIQSAPLRLRRWLGKAPGPRP